MTILTQSTGKRLVNCAQCASLLGMTREWSRRRRSRPIIAQAWCRICGCPATIELPTTYAAALDAAYVIDDRQATHNHHAESGGWGVHWCLDSVLLAAFPFDHTDPCFPTPSWYVHDYDDTIGQPPVKILFDPRSKR